jgi:hypothetical protein
LGPAGGREIALDFPFARSEPLKCAALNVCRNERRPLWHYLFLPFGAIPESQRSGFAVSSKIFDDSRSQTSSSLQRTLRTVYRALPFLQAE